jgi:hypothetical protein
MWGPVMIWGVEFLEINTGGADFGVLVANDRALWIGVGGIVKGI